MKIDPTSSALAAVVAGVWMQCSAVHMTIIVILATIVTMMDWLCRFSLIIERRRNNDLIEKLLESDDDDGGGDDDDGGGQLLQLAATRKK